MDAYSGSLPRPGWEDRARCAGEDRELFFAAQPHEAKRMCAVCPVSDDCLAFALASEPNGRTYRHGVFGGMTGDEREAFSRALLGAVA